VTPNISQRWVTTFLPLSRSSVITRTSSWPPDLDTYYSGQVSVSSAPSVVMAMGGLQPALAYAAQKRAGKAVPESTSGGVSYWTTKVAGVVQDMQGYAMRASVANESLRPALMPAN